MNRLQSELHRLYVPRSLADDPQSLALIEPPDRVRAMVLEIARPSNWELLSRVWHGVQTELGLPAPGIAVSGTEGLQLWFALAEPIAAAPAHAFLEALRSRFLPEVDPSRVRLLPSAQASSLHQELHARLVPACQEPTGNWSAFVASDLAPIFSETPWLDIAPSEEGQAGLLRSLAVMQRPVFEAALAKLAPAEGHLVARDVAAPRADAVVAPALPSIAEGSVDPQEFLLRVMNDAKVPLALRIDAAKALLQHANGHPPLRGT